MRVGAHLRARRRSGRRRIAAGNPAPRANPRHLPFASRTTAFALRRPTNGTAFDCAMHPHWGRGKPVVTGKGSNAFPAGKRLIAEGCARRVDIVFSGRRGKPLATVESVKRFSGRWARVAESCARRVDSVSSGRRSKPLAIVEASNAFPAGGRALPKAA